jgi:hypothetical protein
VARSWGPRSLKIDSAVVLPDGGYVGVGALRDDGVILPGGGHVVRHDGLGRILWLRHGDDMEPAFLPRGPSPG